MAEHKVKFYELLTNYWKHERSALELAKCYHAVYSTKSVQEEEAKWKEALTNTVVFLCLSEYSNEVKDMMERRRVGSGEALSLRGKWLHLCTPILFAYC